MTGRAGAHVFVGGVLEVSSDVADSRRCDTLDLTKYGFHSPETAGCKRRLLHVVSAPILWQVYFGRWASLENRLYLLRASSAPLGPSLVFARNHFSHLSLPATQTPVKCSPHIAPS